MEGSGPPLKSRGSNSGAMAWNGWWTAAMFFGCVSGALAWSTPGFDLADPLSMTTLATALLSFGCLAVALKAGEPRRA